MNILVTGHAGFIGFHTAKRLLERGDSVIGIDNMNDYYDINLKENRLKVLEETATNSSGTLLSIKENLANTDMLFDIFSSQKPDQVINLAAQAGVRHSIEHPEDYVESNLIGFANILEACKRYGKPHLTYASTSSVYGANTKLPFSENDNTNHPIQFYAATKKANELMAHSYSHMFGLPTTGLRFFTVYGPWGRPDMALFIFTKSILEGKPIKVFNNGNHSRDFTYVDDIVQGIILASDHPAKSDKNWHALNPNPSSSNSPYRIYNIGNNNPTSLLTYINTIESELGKKAIIEYHPLQLGDVPNTYADISLLEAAFGYVPHTEIEDGVKSFIEWYAKYYKTYKQT